MAEAGADAVAKARQLLHRRFKVRGRRRASRAMRRLAAGRRRR